MSWQLYPQDKSSQYPLDTRLGGPQPLIANAVKCLEKSNNRTSYIMCYESGQKKELFFLLITLQINNK
jgi:hypothetical protein